jgi:hypothetical protein
MSKPMTRPGSKIYPRYLIFSQTILFRDGDIVSGNVQDDKSAARAFIFTIEMYEGKQAK